MTAADREIPADYRYVSATELCTTVGRRRRLGGDHRAPDGDAPRARRRQRHGRDRRAGSPGHGRQRRRLHRRGRPGRHRALSPASGATSRCRSRSASSSASPSPSSAPMTAARRGRDRFRQSADRPAVLRRRRHRRQLPQGNGAGPHLRLPLPTSRQLWARGFCPRRLARQRRRHRRGSRDQSRGPALHRTSSSVTRRSTRSATSRLPARRSSAATAPIAAATGSTCSRSKRCSPIRDAWSYRRGAGPVARAGTPSFPRASRLRRSDRTFRTASRTRFGIDRRHRRPAGARIVPEPVLLLLAADGISTSDAFDSCRRFAPRHEPPCVAG